MTGENDNVSKKDGNLNKREAKAETLALSVESQPTTKESQPTRKEPQNETEGTTQTKAAPKQAKKKTGVILLLVFLLLILVTLTAGGYFTWRYWNQYSSAQEQRLNALENTAIEQGSLVQTLSSAQAENTVDQNEIVNSLQASQEVIQQRLDSHTQRIRALAGTSRDDWLLAEARYLLRLANQRLLVERGTDGARALLESADSILLSVDDSGVMPVRSAIADEVIALKLAKSVDRQGLYLQLAAIKKQIQALPLVPFRPTADKADIINAEITATSQQKTNTTTPWHHKVWNSIKTAFSNLGRFVQIRHHDQPPELLITEQQQLQTINHLTLMLEQAQFALLHEEEMIYRNSLEEAIKWWDNYYSHYNEHEVIRSEMKILQQKNIIQILPVISRSSELLTDYIERFHKLNNTKNAKKVSLQKNNISPSSAPASIKPDAQTINSEAATQEPLL